MHFDSSSSYGRAFRILAFSENHRATVGVVMDGVNPGLSFDLEVIQKELTRRRPGWSGLATPRSEGDGVQVLSGIFPGRTTGHPIAPPMFNENQWSGDNEQTNLALVDLHCDFVYQHLGRLQGTNRRLKAFVRDRVGHDWRYVVAATKIQGELGWKPVETFADGIAKFVTWYLDQGSASGTRLAGRGN